MVHRTASNAGFTLIELMIAIAVLATLLGIAMPQYRAFQQAMSMKATARNVAASLRQAQSRAAALNRPAYLDLDDDANGIVLWVDQDLDGAFDGDAEVTAGGLPVSDDVGGAQGVLLPKGTRFESTTFPDGIRGVPVVEFAPDGTAEDAGEVVIEDQGGRRYKLEVTAAGGISIFQKIGGTWVE